MNPKGLKARQDHEELPRVRASKEALSAIWLLKI